MSKVYKQAERLIFFLGDATFSTNAFMDYMGHVQEGSKKYAYRSWKRDDKRWELIQEETLERMNEPEDIKLGLRSLLNCDWFHRVWILQEVANAQRATVWCGTKHISAIIFSIAPIILNVSPSVHCQSVIDIMPGPWRETLGWSKDPSLCTLLLRFGGTKASESRDLIYALRGITTDKDSPILMPDYDKPEECIVRDVVRLLFDFEYDTKLFGNIGWNLERVVRALGRIKDGVLWERIKAGELKHLENLLRAPGITVSQAVFEAAIQYDQTGEIMCVLLKYLSKCEVNTNTVLLAIEKGSAQLATALEHHVDDKDIAAATKEMLLKAAKHESHGALMMKHLLPRSQGLDDYTKIAEAAVSNTSQNTKIIQQLVDRGVPITLTHKFHHNALANQCYKEIFEPFIGRSCGLQVGGDAPETGVEEKNQDAENARRFFRSLATFLVNNEGYHEEVFDIFKQSCRWLESHGYFFLEELTSCAVQVFKDSAEFYLSQLKYQFHSTLDWIAKKSGLKVEITVGAVQAGIDGDFETGMERLLKWLQDSAHIHILAAARLISGYYKTEERGDIYALTEHILLYREAEFRHHEVIKKAFQQRYFDPAGRPLSGSLFRAIVWGYRETVRLLVTSGVDTNEEGPRGLTPLLKACSYGDCRIPALLLAHNANVNTQQNRSQYTWYYGRSPILCAIKGQYSDLLELLLVCGADVNAGDIDGNIPLLLALEGADTNKTDIVRLLLQYGADKTLRSPSGKGVDDYPSWQSDAIKSILQEPSPRPSISLSPSVQKVMTEFGLVPTLCKRVVAERGFIYSTAVYIVMQCVFIYIPLSYPMYAASLFAANDFFRSGLACGSILFAYPLFVNLGVDKGVSLLSGLSIIGIIGIWLLYYYGARLRALSKFAI